MFQKKGGGKLYPTISTLAKRLSPDRGRDDPQPRRLPFDRRPEPTCLEGEGKGSLLYSPRRKKREGPRFPSEQRKVSHRRSFGQEHIADSKGRSVFSASAKNPLRSRGESRRNRHRLHPGEKNHSEKKGKKEKREEIAYAGFPATPEKSTPTPLLS